MIKSLIVLSLLVWPFGHLLDISLGDTGLSLPLLDILVFLIFVASIPLFIKKRKRLVKDILFKPIAFFLLFASLSLVLRFPFITINQLLRPLLYLMRLIVYISFYFSLQLVPIKSIFTYLKISLSVFITLGLLQYLFKPDMSFLKYLGYDDHYFRLIGSLFDPNFTGAILSAVSIYLISRGSFVMGLLTLIPLGFTFSRASYLSFIIPLIINVLSQKKVAVLLLPALLVLSVAIAPKPFGEGVNLLRTFSISSRVDSMQQGLDLFIQRPVFGWGFNTLVTGDGRVGIDNSFIFILATTGIFGFASFIYLLGLSLGSSTYSVKLCLLSLLVHGLFNNTLFFPWIIYFWVFLLFMGKKESIKDYTSP